MKSASLAPSSKSLPSYVAKHRLCIFYFTFRVDMDKWYSWFNSAFQRCPPALPWFVDYITDDPQTYIV